jgi:hypothetical protein
MPFDWKAFLDLARMLQQQASQADNPEAVLRTALSRAYYGAFCHARNYARDFLQFQLRGDQDDHGRLKAHLRSKKRQKVAECLDRLRQWRNDSDYADELNFDPQSVLPAALSESDYVFAGLLPPQKA